MPVHLFCYGSLCLAPVMRAVCGTVPDSCPATLHDFACFCLRGQPYPAIAPRPGVRVSGLVYLDVTPAQLRRLDRYEGTLYYRTRVRLDLHDGDKLEAWTYVLRMRYYHRRSRRQWSLQDFLHKDFKSSLHCL